MLFRSISGTLHPPGGHWKQPYNPSARGQSDLSMQRPGHREVHSQYHTGCHGVYQTFYATYPAQWVLQDPLFWPLCHRLPERFRNMPYPYGKSQFLPVCEGLPMFDVMRIVTGIDPSRCKQCKGGRMIPVAHQQSG